MNMINSISRVAPIRKINSCLYHYNRNRWRWSHRFRVSNDFAIDRPIFLLGNQGGGLTLLSRILQRHPQVVYCTGNSRRWGGADEAQNVYKELLPEDAGWRRIRMQSSSFGDSHGWVYASDAMLPYYRRKAKDFDPYVAACYIDIIGRIIALNRTSTMNSIRFLDKSQTVTVRVGFFNQMLKKYNPKFLLVSRNPYAMVWRAATGKAMSRKGETNLKRRVKIAAQHWSNSFAAALADSDEDSSIDLMILSFEEMLKDISTSVQRVCDFVELPYDASMIPGPNDSIPWGAGYDAFSRHKWYPLRVEVNDSYLDELPGWACVEISDICGPVAERLGYDKP